MHSAPSVSYPVGRSALLGWLSLTLGLLGVLAALWWIGQSTASDWRHGLALASAILCGAAALSGWLRTPQGLMHWDGKAWYWARPVSELAGHLTVHLDWQRWMLLRWQAPGVPAVWLWAERARQPGSWQALRRAVYSRADAT
jgi:hypothetical protein